jgi:UDP-N-acetylmuramate--alanine ligase
VIAIFQPHRYSRTLAFSGEFANALAAADSAVLLDIYSAGEEPIPGASSAAIAAAVSAKGGTALFEPNLMRAIDYAIAQAHTGDIILTLGAGDVTSLGPQIISALNEC